MTNKILDEINEYIVKNRFSEAFDALGKETSIAQDVMQLHTLFNQLENEKRSVTISNDDYAIRLAKITKPLLAIVGDLKKSLTQTEEQQAAEVTTNEKEKEVYQTIGNNMEKGNYDRLAQKELAGLLYQIQDVREKLSELSINHQYLSGTTRLLVGLESAFGSFKKHLKATNNENTALDSKVKAALSKIKEALKEISTARKDMQTSEANDHVRSHVMPYCDLVLEKTALEIDKLVVPSPYKFSPN